MQSPSEYLRTAALVFFCSCLPACSTMNAADANLNARVAAAIESNGSLAANDITVRTRHGEVTLAGIVSTETDRLNAAEAAAAVPGVVKVWNQIGAENR